MSPSRNPLRRLREKWAGRGGGPAPRKAANGRRAAAKAELRDFQRSHTGSPGNHSGGM